MTVNNATLNAGNSICVGGNGAANASGTLTIGGSSTFTASGYMVMGDFENACSGTVNIQDTATLNVAQGIYVGHVGAGTFNQSGGTVTTAGGPSFRVGSDPGSSGTATLTGGVLQINGLSQGSGTALFNFGGGTIQALRRFSPAVCP